MESEIKPSLLEMWNEQQHMNYIPQVYALIDFPDPICVQSLLLILKRITFVHQNIKKKKYTENITGASGDMWRSGCEYERQKKHMEIIMCDVHTHTQIHIHFTFADVARNNVLCCYIYIVFRVGFFFIFTSRSITCR